MCVVKVVFQASLPLFVTLVNQATFCLDNARYKLPVQLSIFALVGDNSLVHEIIVMAAVELCYM